MLNIYSLLEHLRITVHTIFNSDLNVDRRFVLAILHPLPSSHSNFTGVLTNETCRDKFKATLECWHYFACWGELHIIRMGFQGHLRREENIGTDWWWIGLTFSIYGSNISFQVKLQCCFHAASIPLRVKLLWWTRRSCTVSWWMLMKFLPVIRTQYPLAKGYSKRSGIQYQELNSYLSVLGHSVQFLMYMQQISICLIYTYIPVYWKNWLALSRTSKLCQILFAGLKIHSPFL